MDRKIEIPIVAGLLAVAAIWVAIIVFITRTASGSDATPNTTVSGVGNDTWETSPVSSVVAPTLLEKALVDATNAARRLHGRAPLVLDIRLLAAARAHGQWMASRQSMRHSRGTLFAENIAAGQRSVAEVMKAWMLSTGHRLNILGPHTKIGVSVYRSSSGTFYWTQEFSR